MPDPLKKYRQMRDFGETPEPAGGKPKKGKRPMFVIQKHQASHLHYDFRLEMEGVLKSWAVPKGPSYDPSVKRLAMMTEDHPYDYGSFEGVIPEGNYGAGNVIIWDTGTWEFIEPGDDPVKAVQAGKLTFRLYGKKMFGEWALVKIRGRSPKGNEWLLIKHRDQYANPNVDVTEVAPRSVVSNLDVTEIGAERTWVSDRKATRGRGAPTLASRLAAEAAAKKTPEKGRAPTGRSRAASSRKRSSRAESPRSARPTRRRRLR
jgi:bifunctional non-homologous end joining protein LigD